MSNTININKKYTTRKGHSVRIYATDCGGVYPVHGAVYEKDFNNNYIWVSRTWTSDGEETDGDFESSYDLIEVDWRKEIPWDYLRDDISFVARDENGEWNGFTGDIYRDYKRNPNAWFLLDPIVKTFYCLDVIKMPEVHDNWYDAWAVRPEEKHNRKDSYLDSNIIHVHEDESCDHPSCLHLQEENKQLREELLKTQGKLQETQVLFK